MSYKGVVDWWQDQKRFGFIIAEDPNVAKGEKILAHYASIKQPGPRDLKVGDKVRFDLINTGHKDALGDYVDQFRAEEIEVI